MDRDVLQQLQPLCFSKGVLVSWGRGRGAMWGAGAQRGAVFKLLSERPSYDRPLKKRLTAPQRPASHSDKYIHT